MQTAEGKTMRHNKYHLDHDQYDFNVRTVLVDYFGKAFNNHYFIKWKSWIHKTFQIQTAHMQTAEGKTMRHNKYYLDHDQYDFNVRTVFVDYFGKAFNNHYLIKWKSW